MLTNRKRYLPRNTRTAEAHSNLIIKVLLQMQFMVHSKAVIEHKVNSCTISIMYSVGIFAFQVVYRL